MREIKENIVYPARFQTESGGGVRITFPDFPELLVIAGDWQEGMELAQRQLALAVIDRLDSGRELPSVAGPHEAVEGPPAAIPSAELVGGSGDSRGHFRRGAYLPPHLASLFPQRHAGGLC